MPDIKPKRNTTKRPSYKDHFPTITHRYRIRSGALKRFLDKSGNSLIVMIERMAALSRMTVPERDLHEKVKHWLAQYKEEMGVLKAELDSQISEVMDGAPDLDSITVNIPETYIWEVSISHGLYWELLSIMEQIDESCAQVEKLFLAGVIDDAQEDAASKQARHIWEMMRARIRGITAVGNRKDNGRYSSADFLDALRNQKVLADGEYPGYGAAQNGSAEAEGESGNETNEVEVNNADAKAGAVATKLAS